MPPAELDTLIDKVLSAPKYCHIHPDLVRRVAEREVVATGRKGKAALKAVKNKLHQIAGAYLSGKLPYQHWEAELRQADSQADLRETCRQIMANHASTAERLPILTDFYKTIFGQLPPIRSVMDLACGLNPLALPWMPLAPGTRYLACDVYADMMAFLQSFFDLPPNQTVRGQASHLDLLSTPPDTPADLALILKTLPVLEQVNKGASLPLLKQIPARYLVVSFPTQSLGGRQKGMAQHYHQEFSHLLANTPWPYERLDFDTELVFLVDKTTP